MRIEPADGADLSWAEDEVAPEWARLTDAEGVVALGPLGIHDVARVGMATFRDRELTWLWVEPTRLGTGIATALLDAIAGPLDVTITNDQLDALRFFQRRGFRLVAAKPMAHDRPRRVGERGIEVRDDLSLRRAG